MQIHSDFVLVVESSLDGGVNSRGSFTQQVIEEIEGFEYTLIEGTLLFQPLFEDIQVDCLRLPDHEAKPVGVIANHLLFAVVTDLDENTARVVIAV